MKERMHLQTHTRRNRRHTTEAAVLVDDVTVPATDAPLARQPVRHLARVTATQPHAL